MSSRSVFAVLAALWLCACGFQPMYGTLAAPAAVDKPIDIANIPNRDGQYLRNLLIDRLTPRGSAEKPVYRLTVTPLARETVNIGVRRDASATRGQMQISGRMTLTDIESGKTLLERDLKIVGAYDLLDNQLATLVTRQNVIDNILQEMAADVVTQLDLYFRRAAP